MTHLVRLRCAACGERVGWVDTGPELVVRYHYTAPKYSSAEKRYSLDDMPVWWTCVRPSCGTPIAIKKGDLRTLAGRATRGKVPTVGVPLSR